MMERSGTVHGVAAAMQGRFSAAGRTALDPAIDEPVACELAAREVSRPATEGAVASDGQIAPDGTAGPDHGALPWRQIVDSLSFGVLEVGGHWRVHYANLAAQAMLRDDKLLSISAGCLCIRPACARERVQRWLAGAARGTEPNLLPMPRTTGEGPLLIELLSAWADAGGEFRCLLALLDTNRAAPLSAGRLTAALGLTAAEARLTMALVGGQSMHEVARAEGIALNTVRKHLENVFARTGVKRQSALVRLALACALPLAGTEPWLRPVEQCPERGQVPQATANAAVGPGDS